MTYRKTKIVSTLGPASSNPQVIGALIRAGVDVVRLNFSHGTHEEHSNILHIVRDEAKKAGRAISILQDLSGPKVRIGLLSGDVVQLHDGQTILLKKDEGKHGDEKVLYVEAFDPTKVLKAGEKVLLADGLVELMVESVASTGVTCLIESGGPLRSRSGLATPDSRVDIPPLTEKDLIDVEWAVKNQIDYVALSFVSQSKDIFKLRNKIHSLGSDIPIVAKFERASSIDNIADIVGASDAVMVARGDLGLELPLERVPSAQKLIIETANQRGTPVITATQMLRSMVRDLRPTRAEVTDVFTAVRDGTDAVMLSEETALGRDPVHVVKVLDRILQEAEKENQFRPLKSHVRSTDEESVSDAICYAACSAANKVSASAILACTSSGYTARLMAKYRPQQPLIGATTEEKTLTKMALYWGVIPVSLSLDDEVATEDEITRTMIASREQVGLKPGSRVVITAGLRAKKSGTTTLMEVRDIPRTS